MNAAPPTKHKHSETCPRGAKYPTQPIRDELLWRWVRSFASIIQTVKSSEGSSWTNDDPPNPGTAKDTCRIYIPIKPLHGIYEEEVRNIFQRSVKWRDATDIQFHPNYNKVMIVSIEGLNAKDGPDPELKFGFDGEPDAHVLVPRSAWEDITVPFEEFEELLQDEELD